MTAPPDDLAAQQWLAADLGPRTARVVVAGVAGGVGATTLAALVARVVARARPGRVALVDHTGGTLAERAGDPPDAWAWAAPSMAQVSVECAGATALLPGETPARAPGAVPLVVAPWHPEGLHLADRAAAGLPGALLVGIDTAWLHRSSRRVPDDLGLPYDVALTAPGAVRDDLLGAPARDAVLAVAVEALARAYSAGSRAARGPLASGPIG
ncbi:hypothetical protein APR04_003465 [Promicromonospora umidemergens]|uniref:Secretion/DNA translocation related CpaE-like protein n=1 Tax=Promicromonospora umidemergens TaxID=629679 RepID=A0ABP8Y160_9MICO|nr:hypothetical protein [Promicromonospora umidemergens]MCP2284542.1 hypothetical protein [Promicromonospora umidemergens]